MHTLSAIATFSLCLCLFSQRCTYQSLCLHHVAHLRSVISQRSIYILQNVYMYAKWLRKAAISRFKIAFELLTFLIIYTHTHIHTQKRTITCVACNILYSLKRMVVCIYEPTSLIHFSIIRTLRDVHAVIICSYNDVHSLCVNVCPVENSLIKRNSKRFISVK